MVSCHPTVYYAGPVCALCHVKAQVQVRGTGTGTALDEVTRGATSWPASLAGTCLLTWTSFLCGWVNSPESATSMAPDATTVRSSAGCGVIWGTVAT